MALTDTAIRNAKPKTRPYKVADSQGLYLLVNPGGSKLWRVKWLCQTKTDRSRKIGFEFISSHKLTPFGQGLGAVLLEV